MENELKIGNLYTIILPTSEKYIGLYLKPWPYVGYFFLVDKRVIPLFAKEILYEYK